ncbi:c-type heme family protein [Desulfurispira natronophila]|uniref:histidine kinase n=1 Tax=Desulfurispira natronophila TaxID=682562 RepID=A0A7W7Y6N4_9BACT|nr:DUF3365 domain-containing protein [Desulfurispira natronophila]MBB5022722.1 PAS domain S-box-containing protein [Desulfurispira natronophila]
MTDLIRKYVIYLYSFIGLILFGVFIFFGLQLNQSAKEQLLDRGRAYMQEIIYVRRWVSLHGGIYVKKQEGMEPSQHLEEVFGPRSRIVDDDGNEYLLRTPAMVTHEVSDLARLQGEFAFRMASTSPINPRNQADEFEAASIEDFRSGIREAYTYEHMEDRQYFRYMAPLPIEPSCVRCHQNYVPGEVHGGISIWVPADIIMQELRNNRLILIIASTLTIALVLIGIYFLSLPFMSRINHRMDSAHRGWENARRRYQYLFHHVRDGIIVLTRDGDAYRIADANDPFCQLFGYPRCELENADFLTLTPEDHKAALQHHLQLWKNEAPPPLECHMRKRDGREVVVEISLSSLDMRHFEGVVAMVRDISERKRLEVQRQILVQQSKMATMGQMLTNITHQWGQPLTGLGLILQNIRKRCHDDTKTQEQVERGLESISFLTQTVKVFRDFLRPSRQKTPFDVARACHEVLHMLSPLLQHHHIQAHIDDKPQQTVMAMGYTNEFKQVVLNLICNAKDSILEARRHQGLGNHEGTISIFFTTTPKSCCIDIYNTGTSLPAGMESQIFNQNFSTRPEGMGIGLFMTRTIIEDYMGGSIRASNQDQGVNFRITLPHYAEPSPIKSKEA